MKFYTYLLYSKSNDRFYIGQSENLVERLGKHNGGLVKSTKPYLPWELVWYDIYDTRSESMSREKKLKNLKSQRRVIDYISKNGRLNLKSSSEFLTKIRESTKND